MLTLRPFEREPTVAISSPPTFPNVLHYWGKRF
jgi:hypothetical protein